MTTAIAKREEFAVSEQPADRLIALALEKQADPGTLEKLMALQERWEANTARKAYVIAMTAFKQEAPAVMVKRDKANFGVGKASYSYANLGDIVQEISALLGKFELSASWQTGQDETYRVVVSCHITHSAGHRETVTLKAPADVSGNKNPIQAIGSTVTYLQRYTLLAALGLATTDQDDDGHAAGQQKESIMDRFKDEKKPSEKSGQEPTPDKPSCPVCGGDMWDNREKKVAGKVKPNAPDYKCKDKDCKGLFWPGQWPPKDEAPGAENKHVPEGCTGVPETCEHSSYMTKDGEIQNVICLAMDRIACPTVSG